MHSYLFRFGIPSLDRLITGESAREPGEDKLPIGVELKDEGAICACIIGPDGTGKSVLGLHLASRYITDCWEQNPSGQVPKVLYLSTDLNHTVAKNGVWDEFRLHSPSQRRVPFARSRQYDSSHPERHLQVFLQPLDPFDQLPDFLLDQSIADDGAIKVGFLDLARNTAGDDWAYVTRLLGLLPPPNGVPRHLLVVDSVEGFETRVGDRDAFGEPASRRSRLMQLVRLANSVPGRSHLVFIAGEASQEEAPPEVFIADYVIRLREVEANGYVRRTVQVEKARGAPHARGQHPFVIRSGKGSTTGNQVNFDDPKLPLKKAELKKGDKSATEEDRYQAYFHVFRSLHYLSRTTMQRRGDAPPKQKRALYVGFGIKYLDDMLLGSASVAKRLPGKKTDTGGLPCTTVTGLIGDSETQKTTLGRIFLSQCFATYKDLLCEVICELQGGKHGSTLSKIVEWRKRIDPQFISYKAWEANLENDATFTRFKEYLRRRFDLNTNRNSVRVPLIAGQLLSPPRSLPEEGVAILLTTHDVTNSLLADDFLRLLARNDAGNTDFPPWSKRAHELGVDSIVLSQVAKRHFQRRILCRRLEIHDLSSPIMMHIVQSYVQQAQLLQIGKEFRTLKSKIRFEKSIGIRLVIDDFSVLRSIYPDARAENLFLPYLLFYLRRKGVTTLIINTDPEKPGSDCQNPFEQEFRSLLDNRLFTWHVPFFGEDKVAIAAIPPMGNAAVRELRPASEVSKDPVNLVVDPHFELYRGLEEGKPDPVPLEVRLYEETPAFADYIRREDLMYSRRFRRAPQCGGVIVGLAASEYETLRDWCCLRSPQHFDHCVICQVDEFWNPGGTAFRKQDRYLGAETVDDRGRPVPSVDHFGVFQLSEAMKPFPPDEPRGRDRRKFFEPVGYKIPDVESAHRDDAERLRGKMNTAEPVSITTANRSSHSRSDDSRKQGDDDEDRLGQVDRIPFMWDFGFLLCRRRWWEEAADRPLKKKGDFSNVGEVWDGLKKVLGSSPSAEHSPTRAPVPWRIFLEACQIVARVRAEKTNSNPTAFDLSLLAPESLSCLVLEIWASDLFDTKSLDAGHVHERRWNNGQTANPESLVTWLLDKPGQATAAGEYNDWIKSRGKTNITGGWLGLYKAWLLLAEVLDIQHFVQSSYLVDAKLPESLTSSVATRHWYKTAAIQSDAFDPTDPLVPCRLPGHFSTRGDWFLAVLNNSLSDMLAGQALDLLSSKRANRVRLQMGLGLPTRFPKEQRGYNPLEMVRIKLFKCGDRGERVPATYGDILNLGEPENAKSSEYYWLWRSRLRGYDRHARIFQRWIGRTLLFWNRLRQDMGRQWTSGFEVFDLVESSQSSPTNQVFRFQTGIKSLGEFAKRCDFLVSELRDATLLDTREEQK